MELGPNAAGSVRMDGVTRRFGERVVVDAISLEVGPGGCVGLVGENGSGKTTALRLMAGTLSPDAGSIEVADGPPGRGGSALVPAGDRGLYWRLSVRDNLSFFAGLGPGRSDRRRIAAAAAGALGLEDLLDLRVEACSTGQRRRVAIARAVASCAPVLLIDEPTEGLDVAAVELVGSVFDRWTQAGGSVVWAAPLASHGLAGSQIVALGGDRS